MKTILTTTLAALLVLVMVGCTGQAAPATAPQTALPLEDCQLSSPGMSSTISARCGWLDVFENQALQSGRKIRLRVAVIPAVSKTPEKDPVLLLAGGPGQAATETFPVLISIFDRLRQKRDLVLVDQRGTGQSTPLECPETEDAGEDLDSAAAKDQAIQALKDCAAQLDADPHLYTTEAFVADLEQVRAALGYEQVNLVGVSYGTRVALAYARLHPGSLRTMTLDSVAAPDWELGPHNPANAQHALDLAFQRCAQDSACSAAFPNLTAEFDQLIAGLSEPVKVSFPDPVSSEMVDMELDRDTAAMTFQILSYSPETVALMPLLVHETVARGDYTLLAAQYRIAAGGLGQSISNGLYLSVLCAEDAPFYPPSAEQADSYLRDRTADLVEQCALWPHGSVSAEYKQPVKSDVPALLLSGEADPVTPPENAEQAAEGLSNSLNLVVPGIGHNVIYRGCVPKVVTAFIEQASSTGLDTACIQKVRPAPFLLNFSGWTP